ncbi:lipopolysaccharide biosynthesis protein [Beijerinckia indica]|nr:oligosaccharide flippase family protein [Beijerinckia indica]
MLHILNTLLRLATLSGKMGLSLYMGRYFSLDDIGTYGLVFGSVMILTNVLGFRLDYVVSRELVRTTPIEALVKMRDQTIFYLANYFVGALIMIAVAQSGLVGIGMLPLFFICALTITDNYSNLTYVNMVSLERPLLANALYFIGGGGWCFVAAAIGLIWPEYRHVDTVLTAWLLGYMLFFTATFWAWRKMPWRELRGKPLNWKWIRAGVTNSYLIWLGTLGIMAGSYSDRFVLAHFLGLEAVGIATFYFSFTNAILTLVQTGVLSFVYPRLIVHYREGNQTGFGHEMRHASRHVALFAGVIAIGISIAVPLLGYSLQRPEFVEYAPVLWLMAAGAWIRCSAEALYQGLFARHQDCAIWLGNLLYVVPVIVCSVVLVPMVGLIGVGYSAVISSLFLLLWRKYQLSRPHALLET